MAAAAYRRVISGEFICESGAAATETAPLTTTMPTVNYKRRRRRRRRRCAVASRPVPSPAGRRSERDGNDPWGAEDADNSSISRRARSSPSASASVVLPPPTTTVIYQPDSRVAGICIINGQRTLI